MHPMIAGDSTLDPFTESIIMFNRSASNAKISRTDAALSRSNA